MSAAPKRILLYGSPVRLALEEAKANYEKVFFDLDERPQWYFANVNSGGKVPTIVYGSSPDAPPSAPSPGSAKITESLVLLEFLADLYPALLPGDAVQRARARAFVRRADEKFHGAFRALLFGTDGGAEMLALFAELQELLPGEGYVAGAEWSIADAAVVPLLAVVGVIAKTGRGYYRDIDGSKLVQELAAPRFARLQEYLQLNKERPSFNASYPEDVVAEKWVKRFSKPLPTNVWAWSLGADG